MKTTNEMIEVAARMERDANLHDERSTEACAMGDYLVAWHEHMLGQIWRERHEEMRREIRARRLLEGLTTDI